MPTNNQLKRIASTFSNSGLQRKDHWREDVEKMTKALNSPHARFIGFVEGKPLMDVSSGLDIYFFVKTELPKLAFGVDGMWKNNWAFLGIDAAMKPIFAIEMSDLPEEQAAGWVDKNLKPIDLRSCAMQFSVDNKAQDRAAILGVGKSLLNWHRVNGYCAECGKKTQLARSGYLRKCINDTCEAEHFPRTDPVVIMLVLYDDLCLLGRSPHFAEGVFSALAGFLEQGETIEEAVKREVMEEVGVEVENVEYILSQPWPFPSSLMIGCVCYAKDNSFKIDGNEIESAKWFTKDEVKAALEGADGLNYSLPPKLAIAHDLLQNWLLQGKN